MRVVFDIEANGLENPSKIWIVACKDIDTGDFHIFRCITDDEGELERFRQFSRLVTHWVGHNILGYDIPVLSRLHDIDIPVDKCSDTLVVSKLVNYSRAGGHSLEQYGIELGFEKIKFSDFTRYSKEMEDYCVRDVELSCRVYVLYHRVFNSSSWNSAVRTEQEFQIIVNTLHNNGFGFDIRNAERLLENVTAQLKQLDEEIAEQFPPKLKPIREITPKVTKHGTLSKSDFRWVEGGDLSEFNGGPFTRCTWTAFNPSSHKQLIEVLHEAGWKPVDKTQTRIELERTLQRARYNSNNSNSLDIQDIHAKLLRLEIYGWKINENNLNTLPEDAPSPARSLAKRILLESRRRTLTEWLGLLRPETSRIHGKFYGIGAWTHRMAHQNPNTANIPTGAKLYGDEMRALWVAPKNRLLVGVDAEGIQLRIFAHYIDDPEFTDSLVKGKKDDKTDPHSLNQRILGSVCRDRQTAKRFIYALLLGAGIGKLAEILGCKRPEAEDALSRLLRRYTGFAKLKKEVIPRDGKRGSFIGLDGREVPIPGNTERDRTHLAMSGYLQNGEAVVMKRASLHFWNQMVSAEEILSKIKEKLLLVNFVHDEWQTEVPNNMAVALKVAELQADSLRIVGEQLGLKCPLAGSYWNEDHKDFTIGTNWSKTH